MIIGQSVFLPLIVYSSLKVSAGFIRAALAVCEPVVITARIRINIMAPGNTHRFN